MYCRTTSTIKFAMAGTHAGMVVPIYSPLLILYSKNECMHVSYLLHWSGSSYRMENKCILLLYIIYFTYDPLLW